MDSNGRVSNIKEGNEQYLESRKTGKHEEVVRNSNERDVNNATDEEGLRQS